MTALCRLDDLRRVAGGGSGQQQVWDVRTAMEWTGKDIHGNHRPGHVPGALNLEWRQLVEGPPQRRLRPPEEIRARLREAGIDPDAATITYCQSGIRAAFAAFVLQLIGNDRVQVYDGSMAEWANREDTPLVVT